MSLTTLDIRLLRILTEKQPGCELSAVATRLGKSAPTARRRIDALNQYLPAREQILLKTGRIARRPDYGAFRSFLHDLPLTAYAPNLDERLRLIAIEAILGDSVNLAELYRELGISEATKKSDARSLRLWAHEHGIEVRVLPRRGVALEGEELNLRIRAAEALLPLIDLTAEGSLQPRRANTPFDNRCVDPLTVLTADADLFWRSCMDELMRHFGGSLAYASKKFLLLYLMVSAVRMPRHPMSRATETPVDLGAAALFSDEAEDRALNLVVSMLDFTPPLTLPTDRTLAAATAAFFDAMQRRIVTQIIDRSECERELYGYAYKIGLRKSRGITFPDGMVRHADRALPLLYRLVRENSRYFEEALEVPFDEDQFTTLALIMRKWTNRSRVFGRNRKRVAIVTNTAQERIDFFIETLRDTVEVEVTGVYDINELDLLSQGDQELVVTFSERIEQLIGAAGYRTLKLSFFLTNEDTHLLIGEGLSTSRRHYRASAFAREMANKSAEELEGMLRSRYPESFA